MHIKFQDKSLKGDFGSGMEFLLPLRQGDLYLIDSCKKFSPFNHYLNYLITGEQIEIK